MTWREEILWSAPAERLAATALWLGLFDVVGPQRGAREPLRQDGLGRVNHGGQTGQRRGEDQNPGMVAKRRLTRLGLPESGSELARNPGWNGGLSTRLQGLANASGIRVSRPIGPIITRR